jgi:polysaccharide export outer membrane protein
MARLTQILITVGTLLILPSQVGAGEFGNAYKASADDVNSKRGKAGDGLTNPAASATTTLRSNAESDGLTPRRVNPVASATTLRSSAESNAYKIGPMDVLDISVFKVPELSKTVEVADTGTINLPLVGEIPAAGKTAQQLERDLTADLGATYLQNPQVTVMVKENNSQRATIQGAVEKPGVYPIKGKTSLLEFLAMAGGFKESSDSTVLLLRNRDGKRSAGKFDVDAIQKGQANDPPVQSGDVIVAGTSAIKAGFNNILKVLPIAGLFAFL